MHLNNVILHVSKLCTDGSTLPLVPASYPGSSPRLGCEAIGGAASAVLPKLRCPPCVPSTWPSVYAPNQHLFLCFRLKADGEPVGIKPGSEANSLQVLVGRGSPSEGTVLENCPLAKLYIQAHPGDHSCLVTKTERIWGRHLAHSMPPQPCPGSEPESPLCTQEWMDSGP